MSWWFLSWRLLVANRLSSGLSILLMGFGVGLMLLMLTAQKNINSAFRNNINGIDMVIGAKGSPLQIILSSVYHLDNPTGNISAKDAKRVATKAMVKSAIPLSFGDSYNGYKILGTTEAYFQLYSSAIAEGSLFTAPFEVVLGSQVAEKLGLALGDTFYGRHGLQSESIEEHGDHPYKIVGILSSNASVIDNLIITSLESVWYSHNHDNNLHQPTITKSLADLSDEQEITALLIAYKSKMAAFSLPRQVNATSNLQAALPAIEVNRLIGLLGIGVNTLLYLAYLVVFVSAVSVFIALYGILKDNLYELALLRSFGALPKVLFLIILQQGLILTFLGFAFGLLINAVGTYILQTYTEANYKMELASQLFSINTALLLLITLIIGLLSALIPAITAYRLNISKILSDA